jgi:Flp pilus assembly protein TadG
MSWLRRLRALASAQGGASVVEFALSIPLTLTLLLGAIEVGRLMWQRHTLEYATEETGRFVMINTGLTTTQIEAQFRARLTSLPDDQVTVAVANETTGGVNFVRITTRYQFNFMTSFLPLGSVPLTSIARVPQ